MGRLRSKLELLGMAVQRNAVRVHSHAIELVSDAGSASVGDNAEVHHLAFVERAHELDGSLARHNRSLAVVAQVQVLEQVGAVDGVHEATLAIKDQLGNGLHAQVRIHDRRCHDLSTALDSMAVGMLLDRGLEAEQKRGKSAFV